MLAEGRSPIAVGQSRRLEGAHREELHYEVPGERFVTLESLRDDIRAGVVQPDPAVLDLTAVHTEDEASIDEIFARLRVPGRDVVVVPGRAGPAGLTHPDVGGPGRDPDHRVVAVLRGVGGAGRQTTGGAVPATHRALVSPGPGAQHSVTAGLHTVPAHTEVVRGQRAGGAVHHGGGQQVVSRGVLHLAVESAPPALLQVPGGPADVVRPALLGPEVCRAVTGRGGAGLISQSVPGTVETSPGWWRSVTLPD